MKKLVGRTILITLLSIILAIVVVFFAMFIFTPKTLGDISDGMGSYSFAVYFYEKQYNKTGETEDLYVLVNKLEQKEDCNKCENFANALTEKEDFISFCSSKNVSGAIDTIDFIYGKLAISTYYNSGLDCAIDRCKDAVSQIGYTENNSFRLMFLSLSEELTSGEKVKITNALKTLKGSLSSQERTICQEDINYLSN